MAWCGIHFPNELSTIEDPRLCKSSPHPEMAESAAHFNSEPLPVRSPPRGGVGIQGQSRKPDCEVSK